jgi:transposase InsO family protein
VLLEISTVISYRTSFNSMPNTALSRNFYEFKFTDSFVVLYNATIANGPLKYHYYRGHRFSSWSVISIRMKTLWDIPHLFQSSAYARLKYNEVHVKTINSNNIEEIMWTIL